MTIHTTDSRIGATVLAALRHWQRRALEGPTQLPGLGEYEIATNGGEVEPLTSEEVDALAESLNCGGAVMLPGADAPMRLSEYDMALIIGGVQMNAGNGPSGNLLGHKADCEELAGRLQLFEGGAVIADGPPILRPETLARIEAGREKFLGGGLDLIGREGPVPAECRGRGLRLHAIIGYPGSAVTDLLIGAHKVQVPNDALRAAVSLAPEQGPPVAAILAELDRMVVELDPDPAGAEIDEAAVTPESEEAEAITAHLLQLRAFIVGEPAKAAPEPAIHEAEGCEPFTANHGKIAEANGWCLNMFGDGQLCIAADDDQPAIFSGKNRNLDAHAHVEEVVAAGPAGGWAPFYVEACERALALCKATEPLPRWEIELIANGVQVTADDEGDAKRYAREDAGEFMSSWGYSLGSIERTTDDACEDADEIEIDVGDGEQDTSFTPPEPGPIAESTWTFSPTFRLVVEAENPGKAMAAAFDLLGVPLNSNRAAIITAVMAAEGTERDPATAQPPAGAAEAPPLQTFTAFCQEAGELGTIWISQVEAVDALKAEDVAVAECAADWGYSMDQVHCLGIAAGDVKILSWQDQGE